ncbi:uncharacterized protein LOC132875345 [Neoarius graeffei]|uniref:uncharacterized protein LOC132875345 n=1 Tax=Neoarius graeffei TaxID=443677 RepID=UPI00298C2C34|nr:uncharacterized protein LOC132875345 [Neoarius graeffei]
MDRLKKKIPELQEVHSEAECDIILVFCPVITAHAYDINAALEKLNQISDTKPAVLVVLHHTFNPEYVVPDSSRSVNRDNTITVDCLFHEDHGILQCKKNEVSLKRIVTYIKTQTHKQKPREESMEIERSQEPCKKKTLKYFILQTGHTLNTPEIFTAQLQSKISSLKEAYTVDGCDFILTFCPVVSRAGTDIEAGMKKLNDLSGDKPAVLVVLHHTFNPECVVPDSSRSVNRGNTITVDCLFHENMGLLNCSKNQESFIRIINYIKSQCEPILSVKNRMETDKIPVQSPKKTRKYFSYQGNTSDSHEAVMNILKHMSEVKEVQTEEECDFYVTFRHVRKHDREQRKHVEEQVASALSQDND